MERLWLMLIMEKLLYFSDMLLGAKPYQSKVATHYAMAKATIHDDD